MNNELVPITCKIESKTHDRLAQLKKLATDNRKKFGMIEYCGRVIDKAVEKLAKSKGIK